MTVDINVVSPTLRTTPTSKLVTLAAGCFWGVEKVFTKQFKGKGLVDVKVGYANGQLDYPKVSYQEVCSGKGRFVESIQIAYEPSQLKLEDILGIFFRMHDPTTVDSQGKDKGIQYRSAIFHHDLQEEKIASQIKKEINETWYPKYKIATVIEPIKIWYDAETYHQKYLELNPSGYECSTHFIRTAPKI